MYAESLVRIPNMLLADAVQTTGHHDDNWRRRIIDRMTLQMLCNVRQRDKDLIDFVQ